MSGFLVPAAIILAGGAVWALVRWTHLRRVATMKLAAEELGVEVEPGSVWGHPRLHGRIDGIEVEARCTGSGSNSAAQLAVVARAAACPELRLAERRAVPRYAVRDEVATGDGLFDGAWRVEGPLGLALAVLDEPTRGALLEAGVDVDIFVRDGNVVLNRLGAEYRWDLIVSGVQTALDVARRLPPIDADAVPERLAERARDDSEAPVRAAALGVLVREHRDHPACARALADLAGDASPEVRRIVLQAQGVPADGRLSVSEPTDGEGELSLADSAAGGVSVES